MATRIVINKGKVSSVYDDRFMPIFKALGEPDIQRATDVEFIEGEWQATHIATGHIIARGPNRNEVISQEVIWLEVFLCHIQ